MESIDPLHDSPSALDGTPWWKLRYTPNSRVLFGGEKRLAAYLWFNKNVGDTFTMRELRAELGDEEAETAEHLNRRLRNLRPHGWRYHANKDERTLPRDVFRLVAKGNRLWLGEGEPTEAVSAKTRRYVFERDGSRCTICGIGVKEEYADEPGSRAKMTLGHRIPKNRGGTSAAENLRTECTRCNEPMRDEAPNPETFAELFPAIRDLGKNDLRLLHGWLVAGERPRSKLDRVYDRARQLGEAEKAEVIRLVKAILGD